jgi:hypothetical protein
MGTPGPFRKKGRDAGGRGGGGEGDQLLLIETSVSI